MEKITIQNKIEGLSGPYVPEKQPLQDKEVSFGETLRSAISDVNKLQTEADQAVQELAAGKKKDIHQTMIALEKAEVSFQLMMQVRNKIVAAYEEIMRMQV